MSHPRHNECIRMFRFDQSLHSLQCHLVVLSRILGWRSMLQDLMRQASIGGGQGMSLRTYGLACDQLTGLTMVDYQGNVIQASSTQNQDLLWASCGGGGGNLGIVTSFTIKTNSLSSVPYVTTAVINWVGYSSAAQIFDKASLRTIQCGWNKSKLQTQISDSWVSELCMHSQELKLLWQSCVTLCSQQDIIPFSVWSPMAKYYFSRHRPVSPVLVPDDNVVGCWHQACWYCVLFFWSSWHCVRIFVSRRHLSWKMVPGLQLDMQEQMLPTV